MSASCRYLLFYKPYGVLCQFSNRSESPRPTLKDYIDVPLVYSVGRLDRDSEGLLLLTDNGSLKHRLLEPRFRKPKTYWVQVEGIPDAAAIAQLRDGVTIQDYRTRPAGVTCLDREPDLPPREPPIRFRKTIPTTWIELVLTEGRNRQVRRMTAAVGFPTLRLVRVGIADLTIAGLAPGQWRDLTPEEQHTLHHLCGLGSGSKTASRRGDRVQSSSR
ncbi:MAG: pseudouridine synthase [Coleofasciculaceae cyanobacterium RL_1_1]|nr:pseudouridine synthase [Coleofasciculaceae cyanobacterium RL_1_1]